MHGLVYTGKVFALFTEKKIVRLKTNIYEHFKEEYWPPLPEISFSYRWKFSNLLLKNSQFTHTFKNSQDAFPETHLMHNHEVFAYEWLKLLCMQQWLFDSGNMHIIHKYSNYYHGVGFKY